MAHIIIYISRADESLRTQGVKEILTHSLTHNNDVSIKGMLMYKEGNFMQVLEGEETQIKSLYEVIKKDSRHNTIVEIYNEQSALPLFDQYNAQFNLITSNVQLVAFRSFLSYRKNMRGNTILFTKLEQFLDMNWD